MTEPRILVHNLRLLRELEDLLERLPGRRIVLLKGLALVAEGSRDLRERAMEDADLLVSPDDEPAVVEALGAMGYRKRAASPCEYVKEGLVFDLMTEIWYLEMGETAALMGRARPAGVGGQTAWVPAPEDHVIFVLAHAAIHHAKLEPKWAEDVRALIAFHQGEFDPSKTRREIERLGLWPPIAWFIRRSGLSVPTWESGTRPRAWAWLDAWYFPNRGHLLRLAFLRDWRFRWRRLRSGLFPDARFVAARYDVSGPAASVARLLRPMRLAAAAFRSVLGPRR